MSPVAVPSQKTHLLAAAAAVAASSHQQPTSSSSSSSVVFDLYTASTISYKHTLLVLLPYILSKVAIAANTAYLQYLFGQIDDHSQQQLQTDARLGGNSNSNENNNNSSSLSYYILASEATIFQWEFLLMGLCMGGLRAVSVMSGKYCSKIFIRYTDLEVQYEVDKIKRHQRRKEIAEKKARGEVIDENDYESEDFWSSSSSSSSNDDDDDDDGAAITERGNKVVVSSAGGWKYKTSVLFRGHLRRRVFSISSSSSSKDNEDEKRSNEEKRKKRRERKKKFDLDNSYSAADLGIEIYTNQQQHGISRKDDNDDDDLYRLDAETTNILAKGSAGLTNKLSTSNLNNNDIHHLTADSPASPIRTRTRNNNNNNNPLQQHSDEPTTQQAYFPSTSSYGGPSSPNQNQNQNRQHQLASSASALDHSIGALSRRSSRSAAFSRKSSKSNTYNVHNCHIPSLVELRLFIKLRSVFVSSFILTTVYGLVATGLFLSSKQIFSGLKILDETIEKDARILDNIQDYCNGFAIGVLPTLWLYGTEQFLLGCHASGTVLVYGVFYAGISSVFAFLFSAPPSSSSSSPLFVYLFSSNPLFGLGLAMSAGAWMSFFALHLHLTFFDREIFRDLCTVFAVAHSIQERCTKDPEQDWRASWETLKGLTRKYFGLSSMMGLSNLVGLASGLLIAVATTTATDDTSKDHDYSEYYSIASAYYQTLGIAVLGASSAVSALVASTDGIAKHFRDKFLTIKQEDLDRAQLGAEYQKIYSAFWEENNNNNNNHQHHNHPQHAPVSSQSIKEDTEELQKQENKAPQLKTIITRSLLVVFVLALLLAIPPLIIPDSFIDFFGGAIYNYNTTSITTTTTSDSSTTTNIVYQFLIPSFLSFVMMTLAMCVSASLHALFDVVFPLVFHIIAYVLGGVWTVLFANQSRNERNSENNEEGVSDSTEKEKMYLIISTYGNVVGPSLYLICLVLLLVKRHLSSKKSINK